VKMSAFAAGWVDEHALSEPLTGAMLDIGIDIFQEILVERGLIPREVAEATRRVRNHPENAELVQPVFDAAFEGRYDDFRAALIDARNYMGFAIAETWKRLTADYFSYLTVAETMISVEAATTGGRFRRAMAESFDWREIGRIKVGNAARVAVDAYPARRFPGRVIEIASEAEFTPRNVQTKKERVNLVFRIKVAVDNPEGILKPGMPADADID